MGISRKIHNCQANQTPGPRLISIKKARGVLHVLRVLFDNYYALSFVLMKENTRGKLGLLGSEFGWWLNRKVSGSAWHTLFSCTLIRRRIMRFATVWLVEMSNKWLVDLESWKYLPAQKEKGAQELFFLLKKST